MKLHLESPRVNVFSETAQGLEIPDNRHAGLVESGRRPTGGQISAGRAPITLLRYRCD